MKFKPQSYLDIVMLTIRVTISFSCCSESGLKFLSYSFFSPAKFTVPCVISCSALSLVLASGRSISFIPIGETDILLKINMDNLYNFLVQHIILILQTLLQVQSHCAVTLSTKEVFITFAPSEGGCLCTYVHISFLFF